MDEVEGRDGGMEGGEDKAGVDVQHCYEVEHSWWRGVGGGG